MLRVQRRPKLLHRPMNQPNSNKKSRCLNRWRLKKSILTLCSILIVQKCTKKLMENSRLNADLLAWRKRKHFKYAIHTNQKEVTITSTRSSELTGWADLRSFVAIATLPSSESSSLTDFRVCTSLRFPLNRPLALTR